MNGRDIRFADSAESTPASSQAVKGALPPSAKTRRERGPAHLPGHPRRSNRPSARSGDGLAKGGRLGKDNPTSRCHGRRPAVIRQLWLGRSRPSPPATPAGGAPAARPRRNAAAPAREPHEALAPPRPSEVSLTGGLVREHPPQLAHQAQVVPTRDRRDIFDVRGGRVGRIRPGLAAPRCTFLHV